MSSNPRFFNLVTAATTSPGKSKTLTNVGISVLLREPFRE